MKKTVYRAFRLVVSVWALIQNNIERKAIKIWGSQLFVNNKLHGQVKNSSFVLDQSQTSQDQQMDQTDN